MKFVSFEREGEIRIGLWSAQGILDLSAAARARHVAFPAGLLELIEAGDSCLTALAALQRADVRPIAPRDVRLLAPIPRPRKNIFCIGKNYVDHVQEMSGKLPPHPVVFSKAPTTVIGPEAEIDGHPSVTRQLDYEGELAVVIGKRAKSVKEQDAYECVFGYTIVNDVTARDKQQQHGQWFLGKNFDSFCPMGPVLVHKSALADPHKLRLETRVNGETRQSANTAQMIFRIPRLIAVITEGVTLEPGDIIATGTPSGVGKGFTPPRYLKAGDLVEVEIEGIGVLRNRVR